MNECIFCKIIRKEINADIIDEDDNWLAFRDIDAKAPVHILLIPKKHILDLMDIKENNIKIELFDAIQKIARDQKIQAEGFRVVSNIGQNGGQAVFHLHFHIMGGRKLGWPPG